MATANGLPGICRKIATDTSDRLGPFVLVYDGSASRVEWGEDKLDISALEVGLCGLRGRILAFRGRHSPQEDWQRAGGLAYMIQNYWSFGITTWLSRINLPAAMSRTHALVKTL